MKNIAAKKGMSLSYHQVFNIAESKGHSLRMSSIIKKQTAPRVIQKTVNRRTKQHQLASIKSHTASINDNRMARNTIRWFILMHSLSPF